MFSIRTDHDAVQGFLEDQAPLVRNRVTIILYFGIFLVPLFGVVDYIIYPEHLRQFMSYRLLTAFLCLLLYFINLRWNLGQHSFYLGVVEFYLVGAIIIAMIVSTRPYTSPYYAGLNLVFIIFCSVLTISTRHLVFHCLTLYLLFVSAVLLTGDASEPHAIRLFLTNNMFVLSTIFIVLTASSVDFRLRKREYLLRQELKQRTTELEQAHEELLRRERLAVLGKLIAVVSHELRNPLGTIRSSLFALGERVRGQDAGIERILDRAERSILRCDKIIEELLDYSRVRSPDLEATEVDPWLDQVLSELIVPEGIVLQRRLAAGVTVQLDRERLRRCVQNVAGNAFQSLLEKRKEGAERAPFELQVASRVHGDRVELSFSDNGTGIAAEQMEKIFQPLYSTRGFGVGLGLTIVKQIMEQHAGGIEIESRLGLGTTVTLWLPV